MRFVSFARPLTVYWSGGGGLSEAAWRYKIGLNIKNPPKTSRLKKIVKLTDYTSVCNDLTNFESKSAGKDRKRKLYVSEYLQNFFGGF